MQFSIRALVNAAALVGGASVFFIGIANMVWPGYGLGFLQVLASLYPGYHADGKLSSVLLATLYAMIASAVCAAVFGWIYNWYARKEEV